MNDRYLFRAKRIDNGEWVEGYYFCMVHDDGRHAHHFIMPLGTDLSLGTPIEKIQVEVDLSTICQCTGMKGIYEHDIFECDGETYEIVFDQDDLVWWADGYGHQYIQLGEFKPDEIKVVGNIFDNPELLEQED